MAHAVAAAFALDALDDLERALEGLRSDDAERSLEAGSISWTVAHVAQHIDSWVVGEIGRSTRNPYFNSEAFQRGAVAQTASWSDVDGALRETLDQAGSILGELTDDEITQPSEYLGSIDALKGKLVTPHYRLLRLGAHIYYHVADITSMRATLGTQAQDFPGVMWHTYHATLKDESTL